MIQQNPLSQEILQGIFRTSPNDPTRIINREGTTIEFKETYNHGGMAQYFRTMAGFANNIGGYILFGIGDRPRRLIGLEGKKLQIFEELKVEEFTKNLQEYFSPEIHWDHCTFEFRGKKYGVIYVYPLKRKPCICKKYYEAANTKYSLKEGDIYYRYGGRSERIRYEELYAIIEETRRQEELQWLNFAKKAVRIGVSNAGLLDLTTGNLSGVAGSVILDDELIKKVAFIKEGKFVENGGTPTLRVIGDVTLSSGKVVVSESSKKVVKAIEPSDIVRAFLEGQPVSEPLEYVKCICLATSAYYPVYFFLKQAQISNSDAVALIKGTTTRSATKNKLIERLEGKELDAIRVPTKISDTAAKREEYRIQWLMETLPEKIEDVAKCVEAVLYLTNEQIVNHQRYIRTVMLRLFTEYYVNASSNVASNLRKAVCRIDEAIYLNS